MESGSNHYLEKLTSLRFFAAFLVVLFHLGRVIEHQQVYIAAIGTPIAAYGYVGVSIFFVLSGFVISLVNDRWKGWSTYILGRITRIYPPHLIVTFTLLMPSVVALITHEGTNGWLKLLSNLTLIQAWSSNTEYYRSLNVVTWSLSVEMNFYVAFIALRRLRDSWLFILTATAYLILLVFTIYLHHKWTFDIYWKLYVNPLARLPEFLTGMSIYRLYRADKLPRLWLSRFNFVLILIVMLATMYLVGIYGGMGGTFAELLDYSVVPLPFITLMMMALLDSSSNKWMHNHYLVLLGESSFALYLIHRPLIGYMHKLLSYTSTDSWLRMLGTLLISILIPISISVLFYRFIELPITRTIRHRLITRTA